MATATKLDFLEPTTKPTTQQDPSAPIIGHAAAFDTGKKDTDGGAILMQAAADVFSGGEVLADQAGANAVLTFAFASGPCSLVWVRCDGGQGRADPFGGAPDSTHGIRCDDGVPNPITVNTSVVKVYASTGTTVQVWGMRY